MKKIGTQLRTINQIPDSKARLLLDGWFGWCGGAHYYFQIKKRKKERKDGRGLVKNSFQSWNFVRKVSSMACLIYCLNIRAKLFSNFFLSTPSRTNTHAHIRTHTHTRTRTTSFSLPPKNAPHTPTLTLTCEHSLILFAIYSSEEGQT